jgi:PLP dependent protein
VSVAAQLDAVRARIAAAEEAAGRPAGSARLIAVSKEQPVDRVFEAYDHGATDFGENTAQGLTEKAEAFARSGRTARFHFIGRLQRNKVNLVLRHAAVVHSVDRLEVALALSKRVGEARLRVLLQVNIGREQQKGGVEPEAAVPLAREVAQLPGLELAGLMGIPPADVDPSPFFAELAALSCALVATPEGARATELSMGMTQDFEIAIRHGATLVRVGTAIFGDRPPHGAVG